jgi:hypothetical protein
MYRIIRAAADADRSALLRLVRKFAGLRQENCRSQLYVRTNLVSLIKLRPVAFADFRCREAVLYACGCVSSSDIAAAGTGVLALRGHWYGACVGDTDVAETPDAVGVAASVESALRRR